MPLTPWHGSRTFGTVAVTIGVISVLNSIFKWNFLEINRPSGLAPSVQRVLIGCMGVVFILMGILFFWANF